jgi:hypothetical protein
VAASRIYLQGGPCNGRTVSADRIVGGLVAYIKCDGGYYVVDPGKHRPNGNLIFKYSGTSAPKPPSGPNPNAPQALKGWKAIRKAVNRGMPSALTYSQRHTSAALRTLHRARKVRL